MAILDSLKREAVAHVATIPWALISSGEREVPSPLRIDGADEPPASPLQYPQCPEAPQHPAHRPAIAPADPSPDHLSHLRFPHLLSQPEDQYPHLYTPTLTIILSTLCTLYPRRTCANAQPITKDHRRAVSNRSSKGIQFSISKYSTQNIRLYY